MTMFGLACVFFGSIAFAAAYIYDNFFNKK